MSKAVMLSIQPKWCKLIASGKKTVEVRKTRPKLEMPFKCYIYETKTPLRWNKAHNNIVGGEGGRVIGEFVCDFIYEFDEESHELRGPSFDSVCLTPKELFDYGNGKYLYGLKISNLIIYDKPRELTEFIRICPEWEKEEVTEKCIACNHFYRTYEECKAGCDCEGEIHLTKAPQSWCYVEELCGA